MSSIHSAVSDDWDHRIGQLLEFSSTEESSGSSKSSGHSKSEESSWSLLSSGDLDKSLTITPIPYYRWARYYIQQMDESSSMSSSFSDTLSIKADLGEVQIDTGQSEASSQKLDTSHQEDKAALLELREIVNHGHIWAHRTNWQTRFSPSLNSPIQLGSNSPIQPGSSSPIIQPGSSSPIQPGSSSPIQPGSSSPIEVIVQNIYKEMAQQLERNEQVISPSKKEGKEEEDLIHPVGAHFNYFEQLYDKGRKLRFDVYQDAIVSQVKKMKLPAEEEILGKIVASEGTFTEEALNVIVDTSLLLEFAVSANYWEDISFLVQRGGILHNYSSIEYGSKLGSEWRSIYEKAYESKYSRSPSND